MISILNIIHTISQECKRFKTVNKLYQIEKV